MDDDDKEAVDYMSTSVGGTVVMSSCLIYLFVVVVDSIKLWLLGG